MGGKSKSATVGYWYEVAFHSGLGIGPIDAYLEFRGGDKTAWRGEATHSQTIHINAPTLWGGEKDQGGIVGSVDLMFGEATQQPNSRLSGIFGPQQPAWRGFATLAFAGKYGAMNPYPQKASHKIRKIREGWDGECWYPGKAAIPMPTCSGADPYIHVTSTPYPQEAASGMAPSFALQDVAMRDLFRYAGDYDASAVMAFAFEPATLRPPVAEVQPVRDDAAVAFTFEALTLREPINQLGTYSDAAVISIAFDPAKLRVAVVHIDQSPSPEKAAMSFTFEEATLYVP